MSQNQPAKDAFVESGIGKLLTKLTSLVRERAFGNVIIDLRVEGGLITAYKITQVDNVINRSAVRGQDER